MKVIGYILIFGIIGLVVGYLLFAKFGGHYIPVLDLFFKQDGVEGLLKTIKGAVTGAETIRQKIYISGGVGAALGLVLSFATGGKRRR